MKNKLAQPPPKQGRMPMEMPFENNDEVSEDEKVSEKFVDILIRADELAKLVGASEPAKGKGKLSREEPDEDEGEEDEEGEDEEDEKSEDDEDEDEQTEAEDESAE